MVSKSTASSSKHLTSCEEQGTGAMDDLTYKLTLLKREIQSERLVSIREKLEKNTKMMQAYVSGLELLSASRTEFTARSNDSVNLLSLRMTNPLCKFCGFFQSSADKDDGNSEEVVFSSTAKLPPVEKIPPYTTWIFLDRNQRMADDQSVAGRRRIYYDQHGGEALICSDSEEELGELEGGKHDFSEGEDRMLRVTLLEYGARNEVFDALTRFVGGTSFQIQERWNLLREKDQMNEKQNLTNSREEGFEDNVFLDKSLSFALDSFDNVFCRRCLVFDCRLHGCSQNLILPREKQTYDPEEEHKPCGSQCYFQMNESGHITNGSDVELLDGSLNKAVGEEAIEQGKDEEQELDSDDLTSSSSKKLKSVVSTPVPDLGESLQIPTSCSEHALQTQKSDSFGNPLDVTGHKVVVAVIDKGEDNAESSVRQAHNPIIKHGYTRSMWKQFEKDLCLKGIEIFGRNSCCIARNMLSGLKTCKEVSSYMYGDGVAFPRGSSSTLSSVLKDVGKADVEYMDPEMPIKSRICRKRGRTRKFNKSSWKSAGHPSLWRRIIDGKDQPLKQYVPCACQSSCGKQCSCQQNGACCEKYCGVATIEVIINVEETCVKSMTDVMPALLNECSVCFVEKYPERKGECSQSCKNQFRGCHCAKSQCKSRQCPCFAAGRECDPDVCRNCWVSCGDGALGEPLRQGDGNCGNMKLLLRQQQRILLGRSDIAGWGAFIKNSVNKNDYLGEYTGELISHREADRRGKIYDLADSSFLFDLNDQYVLDAYRKGDKLKFANHSATPNCYAKVMLVAGDHRVGIFANERIEAGEELFYDYRYGPDQALWAQKPDRSKRDGSPVHQGRAKKHQSGSSRL